MCDPHRITLAAEQLQPRCLVYSIVSGANYTFEGAVLSQISPDCELHIFGTTAGQIPDVLAKTERVTFHPFTRVAAGKAETCPALAHIELELGHIHREVDILRIDYKEGCQWRRWFQTWLDTRAVPPRQILITLYGGTEGPSPVPASRFMMYMKSKGYIIFHKKAACGGLCVEYGLLRLKITPIPPLPWQDQFLFIQPTSTDLKNTDRDKEI